MREIEINGLKLRVADDCDVSIDGGVVSIKAKTIESAPERLVEHHHHHHYINTFPQPWLTPWYVQPAWPYPRFQPYIVNTGSAGPDQEIVTTTAGPDQVYTPVSSGNLNSMGYWPASGFFSRSHDVSLGAYTFTVN